MSPESQKEPAPQKQSFSRRFGGYFLGVHRPAEVIQDIPEKSPRELAVDLENKAIDLRQEAHFNANLLRAPEAADARDIRRLSAIKREFEIDLAETEATIPARFELFMEPFYAPHISALDIGETKNPGSHDEVAALKEEYRELLERLVDKKIIDGELPRFKAKPTIHLSFNSSSDYVAATRNRELFSFVDGARTITLAKRMTFLMPPEVVGELQAPEDGRLGLGATKKVQTWIDDQDPDKIIPVRTVYYAKSKPREKTEE